MLRNVPLRNAYYANKILRANFDFFTIFRFPFRIKKTSDEFSQRITLNSQSNQKVLALFYIFANIGRSAFLKQVEKKLMFSDSSGPTDRESFFQVIGESHARHI